MKSLRLDKIHELLADGDGFTSWSSDQFHMRQCPDYAYVRASTSGNMISLLPGTKQGVWLSPVVELDEPLVTGGKIIPSWQAFTPPGTYLMPSIKVRVGGFWHDWRLMFEWAGPDAGPGFESRSMPSGGPKDMIQVDSCVNTTGDKLTAYQLMFELHSEGKQQPLLFKVAAQAMNVSAMPPLGPTTMEGKVNLPGTVDLYVSEFSQYRRGLRNTVRKGGEGLCSPTALAMNLQYLGYGPSTEAVQLCDQDDGADIVDHAARYVYDYEYDGAGNWPFNTAYAASLGADAVVRRFRSLRDLEALIKQRVPVVISLNWDNSWRADPSMALAGTSRVKSDGHLLVVRGFTEEGDVIVNEPANVNENGDVKNVRRVYLDHQVHTRWQSATGGIAYVLIPCLRF